MNRGAPVKVSSECQNVVEYFIRNTIAAVHIVTMDIIHIDTK